MKNVFAFAVVFALFAGTQAFAIIGVGAHYVMNTGSLESSTGVIETTGPASNLVPITVTQESASGLQGLGFKLWIDVLPFVDVEGTFNVSAVRYKTTLQVGNTPPISLEYTPEAPYNMVFDKASPIYGILSGDLSITYPYNELPIIRPYVGAGISYMASIPVVNAAFINKLELDPTIMDADNADKIGDSVTKALKNADYKAGAGGHVIAGFRIKPPIVPLAVYANCKRYFGGDIGPFTQGFVFEAGGGFAL